MGGRGESNFGTPPINKKWIKTNMSKETETIIDPITGKEYEMHSVIVNGLKLYFEEPSEEVATNANELLHGNTIPGALKEVINSIIMIPDQAPGDPTAIAQEEGGNITIFENRLINNGIIAHEAAHGFAEDKWGGAAPPPGSDYAAAINSGEPPVNEYAKTSPGEDFGESVRLYVNNPNHLQQIAPLRYGVINKLMSDPSYSG